jgi:uncharacterized protein with von Willebrand factor type A (vWA) domain
MLGRNPFCEIGGMMELPHTQDHAQDYSADLEGQVEDLKRVIESLRIQLADMRQQRDKWQSRAERISLTAPC